MSDEIAHFDDKENFEIGDVVRINGHVIECNEPRGMSIAYTWNCQECGSWYQSVRNFELTECEP